MRFDGDGYLCFDARKHRDAPCVTYVDIESESARVVAPTFAQFASVAAAPDTSATVVGVTSKVSLEQAARLLGDALGMAITDQGDWAHGYPTIHGGLTRGAVTAQLWISPNEVKRGYVREDHEDYQELVAMLPGTALRYPEYPACTSIIEISDLALDALLDACRRVGLEAHALVL